MKNNLTSKLIRFFTAFLPVDKNRKGTCLQCGACCNLPYKCFFLRHKEGKSYCMIYPLRPPSCRVYPRTEKECLTKKTCGFKF